MIYRSSDHPSSSRRFGDDHTRISLRAKDHESGAACRELALQLVIVVRAANYENDSGLHYTSSSSIGSTADPWMDGIALLAWMHAMPPREGYSDKGRLRKTTTRRSLFTTHGPPRSRLCYEGDMQWALLSVETLSVDRSDEGRKAASRRGPCMLPWSLLPCIVIVATQIPVCRVDPYAGPDNSFSSLTRIANRCRASIDFSKHQRDWQLKSLVIIEPYGFPREHPYLSRCHNRRQQAGQMHSPTVKSTKSEAFSAADFEEKSIEPVSSSDFDNAEDFPDIDEGKSLEERAQIVSPVLQLFHGRLLMHV
nr:hypothetical protein CFP56_72545 [Quercus suber]